ncbi:MAG TPA: hypothetical protein VN934_05715 [Candidatus Tumulicola sp.]|nr:hypothetical protein [Candidatus Tumulicola sp.]
MRGLTEALRWHSNNHGRSPKRDRSGPLNPVTYKRRSSRAKPEIAIIESAILPKLLLLDDDAIRVYVTLVRFANRWTGLAYPGMKLLRRQLGFVPFHTDSYTGVTRLNLTRKQWARRRAQIDRAHQRIQASLDTLAGAGLIEQTYRSNSNGPYKAYLIMGADGKPRKLSTLQQADSFFIVPREVISSGAFGIWARVSECLEFVAGAALRLLLLMMRDSNPLRFGGISPQRLTVQNRAIRIRDGTWLRELGVNHYEFWCAMRSIIQRQFLRARDILASTIDDHLIRDGTEPAASDEHALTVVAIDGTDLGPYLLAHPCITLDYAIGLPDYP